MIRLLGVLFAFAVVFAAAPNAEAQLYQVYYPAPATACYAPAPVPVATYYAPAPTTVYYAPPVATYYRRPLLGGTVSGWRYNYPATVAYYPVW